jgi:hypothetical protein
MPVYIETYSCKSINQRTNVRSMTWQRNHSVKYDRELFRKIDRCAAQRALELVNRRMKIERKQKAGTKRTKEEFDRLTSQDTSPQTEDKHREITALRSKQINSDKCQCISGDYTQCGFSVCKVQSP